MAHNEVAEVGGSLSGLPQLQELRIRHNELSRWLAHPRTRPPLRALQFEGSGMGGALCYVKMAIWWRVD